MNSSAFTEKERSRLRPSTSIYMLMTATERSAEATADGTSHHRWQIARKLRRLLATAAVLLFLGQIGLWLYTGEWFDLPLSALVPADSDFSLWLTRPHVWIGIQKIARFLLDLPIPFVLFLSAVWDGLWAPRA
jgi:hypothetical protein